MLVLSALGVRGEGGQSGPRESGLSLLFKSLGNEVGGKFFCKTIRHLHISYNTPCLPSKTLHNLSFLFLVGITVVLTGIKDVCKIWGGVGQTRFIMEDVKMANYKENLVTC